MTVQQKPPADTGEQSMTTITRDRLQQIARENTAPGEIVPDIRWLEAVVSSVGITIAPPEPPEAMVELARGIAADATMTTGDYEAAVPVALAVLQHVVKKAREEQAKWTEGDVIYALDNFLTALGWVKHDAR